MIRQTHISIVMTEVTDPIEMAKAKTQDERFDRNWAWFEANAAEIYPKYRGKCLCIAGQQLFVADTVEDAVALAKATHPDDNGFFTRYIPKEKAYRIYAH